jgi:hypothetical protein
MNSKRPSCTWCARPPGPDAPLVPVDVVEKATSTPLTLRLCGRCANSSNAAWHLRYRQVSDSALSAVA